ncbi:MAG: type II toxin-antitoxin system prevent-host-death family antitoxin [Chloroflexi bacterium]|nr:type II toxin-antitoxin system prevent-host-death family antitoxin [Chloroflexota bacterium]
MQRTIDSGELGRRSGEVLEEVTRQGVEYVLARDGRPEAALISYEELERLRQH